jgi:hypothetical protein
MDSKAICNVFKAVELAVISSLKIAPQKLIMRIYQALCMSL